MKAARWAAFVLWGATQQDKTYWVGEGTPISK